MVMWNYHPQFIGFPNPVSTVLSRVVSIRELNSLEIKIHVFWVNCLGPANHEKSNM